LILLVRQRISEAMTMTVQTNVKPSQRPGLGRLSALCFCLVCCACVLGAFPLHAQQVPPLRAPGEPVWPDDHPVSLNVQQVDIRGLLAVLAEAAGLNVVIHDAVKGVVSVRFKDVPWSQVMDALLQMKGLQVQREGRLWWISTREESLSRQKAALAARVAVQDMEPLETLALSLRYAKSQDIADKLLAAGAAGGGSATRWLSPRGALFAQARSNQLLVSDVAPRLQQIRQVVEALDVPVRQVQIEARIVEASEQFGHSLGVRLGLAANGPNSQIGGALAPGALTVSPVPSVNFPAGSAGQAADVPSTLAMALFNPDKTKILSLELSALEARGEGKVLSSPRVVTADQTRALIEQGTELPYQTTSGQNGATSVTFRKANLRLEVLPQITPEGHIVLDLSVSKDSVGQLTPAGFAIDTKHVRTQVLVENGGAVMIGGIYEDQAKNDGAQVPGLGDLPGLGWLFKSRQKQSRKTEMLVFISPQVVGHALADVRSKPTEQILPAGEHP
jgi:type IV pilus assembly protein PilQ